MLFELPEVLQLPALMEADGPVVVMPLDRIRQGLSLRVTLDARVVGAHEIEPGRIDDVRGGRLGNVCAARSMTPLAANVPLADGLGLDVVVHRVAPVAERAG